MSLAGLCIRRPIGTCLLAVAVVLAGLLAWRHLPVAPLPQVDYPVIEVYASLPGGSPESMAATVAAPIERAMGSIAGVTAIYSSSNQGTAEVDVEFELGHDINEAARDVQAALNAVQSQLPAGMPTSPRFTKIQAGQRPIMVLALSSPVLRPSELYDTASTILAQKIAATPGVAKVDILGASLPAVRVQLDPAALAHQGMALDEVRTAIADSTSLRPLGALDADGKRWQLAMSEPLRRAADYRPLIVKWVDGRPVRLSDVAAVNDGTENRYSSGFHNERDAVIMMVTRQPGANIVQTVDAIQAQMPYLRSLTPAQAQLDVVLERTAGIRATLREAYVTLGLAVLLVIAVITAFLGRLRTALIPTVAIPVSLIGAFMAMYAWGFSLNNLSLMALIVAAGLVVDDAIVVLENIERYIERGLTPLHAALRGAREVGFTLLAMNAALVIVFVSVLFMGGMVQRLFREFSITLAATVVVSLVVSLTLTPVLCAYGLRRMPRSPSVPDDRLRGWSWLVMQARLQSQLLMDDLRTGYAASLAWVMRHGWLVGLLLAAVLGLNVYLYGALSKIMLPQQDTGIVRVFVRGDDGFSFQVMQPKIEAFRQLILKDPAVAHVTGTSGGSGGLTNSSLMISLKPLAERGGEPTQAVVNRLRMKTPAVAGAVMNPGIEQDIQLGGMSFGNNDHELILRSDDLGALRTWARKVALAMAEMPELADVSPISDGGAQQVVLDIDRQAAARLGVDMQTIASVLDNSYAQRQVATLYDAMNQYHVVMEVDPRYTGEPQSLAQIQVLTEAGERVPLSAFASWRYGLADDRVSHANLFAAMDIGYNLAPGVTAGEADRAINAMLARLMLPSNVHRAPSGQDIAIVGAANAQPWLIAGVLLAVYLVLAILYESTWHPLTVLSTLPSAGVGALLALLMTGTEFSLMALLGVFLLIGVVMKNAILMIDFALDAQRRLRLPAAQAIAQAAQLRLRPILMTNLAGILGALPLILGMGEGAEMRRPLGLVIVGGLLLSQFITLYTTPVVYLGLERLRQRGRNWLADRSSSGQSGSVV